MSNVRLIAAEADANRLSLLVKRLVSLGYRCSLELVSTQQTIGNETIPRPTPLAADPTTDGQVSIICWTEIAIGPDGQALRDHALKLKSSNNYLGLILDDISPPEEVRAAQDIKLLAWETEDDEKFQPLIEVLGRQQKSGVSIRSALLALKLSVQTLIHHLEHLHFRLKALGVVAVITLILSVFGVFADWEASQDAICSWSSLQKACRTFELGHFPSPREESYWSRIKEKSECDLFEKFLRSYGPSAYHSSAAQQRLALARYSALNHRLDLPLSIDWAQEQSVSIALARAEIGARANKEAARFCAFSSQAFAMGSKTGKSVGVTPGTFVGDGEPECMQRENGYSCRWSGRARCTFLVPNEVKTCPK